MTKQLPDSPQTILITFGEVEVAGSPVAILGYHQGIKKSAVVYLDSTLTTK